jgi:MoaA/NifB/PqqE/SkfB family radical SAM enzyme
MKANGLTGAIISLDHWDEEQHNRFRGHEKSFFWVQEAARNCHEAGIVVCLSLCPVKSFVTEENVRPVKMIRKQWIIYAQLVSRSDWIPHSD